MKMTNVRITALILLVALLLTGCNMPITPTPYPTPTPQPPPTEAAPNTIGAACLVGSWQINNLQNYLQAIIPLMVEGATIEIEETSGSLTYTFNADGSTLGAANDFKVKAKVGINGVTLPGEIIVNGESQGNYTADDTQGILTLSNIGTGTLALNAKVAGLPVVNDTPIGDLFMPGSDASGSGSTNYQCIGNTLQISVTINNLGDRIVTLQRVSQ